MNYTPPTNARGLYLPKREGDEHDDMTNWDALDKMLAGTHASLRIRANAAAQIRPTVITPDPMRRMSSYLPKTRSMVNRVRAGGKGLVLVNSDSISLGGAEGSFADGFRKGFAAVMARSLKQLGIPANCDAFCGDNAAGAGGIAGHNTGITPGAGWGTSFFNTLGINFWQNTTTNNAFAYKVMEPVDTVEVYYLTAGVASGDMTVDIGGAVLATMASNQATGYRTTGPVALGSLDLHTINIKRAAGASGASTFMGLRAYNSRNPGVTIINVGGGGQASAALIQTATFGWPNGYALLGPDLVIAGEDINDWITSVTAGAHRTNIDTMLTQSKRAGATDALLFNGPQSRTNLASLAAQSAYFVEDAAAALAAGVPLVSFAETLGLNDNSVAQNLIYKDATGHLTDEYCGLVAHALAMEIFGDFA